MTGIIQGTAKRSCTRVLVCMAGVMAWHRGTADTDSVGTVKAQLQMQVQHGEDVRTVYRTRRQMVHPSLSAASKKGARWSPWARYSQPCRRAILLVSPTYTLNLRAVERNESWRCKVHGARSDLCCADKAERSRRLAWGGYVGLHDEHDRQLPRAQDVPAHVALTQFKTCRKAVNHELCGPLQKRTAARRVPW